MSEEKPTHFVVDEDIQRKIDLYNVGQIISDKLKPSPLERWRLKYDQEYKKQRDECLKMLLKRFEK